MMSFVISKNATSWSISPEAFAAAFAKEFPTLRSEQTAEGLYVASEDFDDIVRVEWRVGRAPTVILERMGRDDAVRLCLLYRRLAPPDVDLVFCDEACNFLVEIKPDTTAEEIKRALD